MLKYFPLADASQLGKAVVGKGVGRKTIREKHIEEDFKKFKHYTKREDVSAYYNDIQ